MKIDIEITEDNILDFICQLPIEIQQKALEHFTYEAVIMELEKHLRNKNYDTYSWDTSWYKSWARLRESIIKIQWLESEVIKDKESIIQSLQSDVKHYKRYYDKMFELYHSEKINCNDLPR